ncbi:hypothetical protein D915_005492 [Fasciola hepatica]|uniref:Uncharacterized protein n=1 Tax=Fasciola hepatica TaxID=6192 RepID=A0A4E0RRU4_FASHE|nr:hypothetical protein D915_005492 [Fasciola hepatica]
MEQRRSVSSNSLPGTPIPRLPIPSLYSMRSTRSMSAPPDFRVNDHMERLIQAFQYYYTAHPITLSIENSPVVMIDLHQNLQDFPKRIIAPDGFIPNSVVRTMLTPVTPPLPHSQTPPTDLASQRLNLEQLVKRYLSDERTKDTLSSITFLKDVALLRIATSATGIERMRGEIMTNLAIEVEGLLEQPCEQILEEDHVEEDEAARMEKTAKLHKFARQITKQTVQRHFEQKVQETLERRVVVQKDEGDDEEEEPFVDEEEQQQEQSTARSGRTPINWRQEEDLIDQLGKNEEEEIQRRMQVERERVLPYDFVRNTLDKMATEWGGMARVMATIHGAIKKKQQQLDQLDSILKSRECRVGMLNSVVSPPWIFLYLSIMLGSSRTLMEFLESLLDPETSADVLNGLRMQLMGYVGPAQRLDQFIQEFGGVKQILEEVLVNRGMPKDAAKSLVYEALCDNPDARSRISQWISMPDPEEAIQAVKICNREKVQALAKALSATKHLDLLPTGTEDGLERAKESADASLLAQLDVDVKRVMQYDGREVEEPEEASSVDRVGTQLRVQLAKPKKIEPKKPKATIFSSPSSSDLSGSMVESPEDMKQSTPTKKALKAAKKEPEPKVGRESEPKEEEIDTYDDFTRAAGAAELESSSRQLQSRTRTVPVSTAKRVKRMPQKTKPKEEEEDDEQGTEAPETTGSFEDKPLGEEEEEGEEDEEEEGLSELLDDELLELDLAAVENELMAMAEESDDILRELDEEEESSPMPTFLKSGEVTSTTEGTYPDPAFQRGAVKRFTANFGHPDDPVREEKIKVSTDTPEEYMNSLSKVTWFTSKGPHAKKEAVVVDIVRSFPQIAKLEDLRAAEIALVLFKRQYGIRSSCVQYVLKVMNKLFFKFLNLIKLARKSKQGSRNEAFVRALATLTVANNYEEDIIEKLDMLKTTRKPRKSRVDKKRMSKESIREGVGILGKLMHTPGEKHEGMSPKEIEELLQAAGEEEQEVSPEDQELIRQKRRDEVANKLRMKAQEKQAMLRQMTKRADQKISRESEEPQSAQSLSEGHGEEDEEGEGEEGRKTSSYDYIRRKKKALQDQETESSSSKESGLHKIEEEISLAAMEAKRRRMKKEKESGEQPRTPTGVARSPVGEQSLSPLPPTQKQLQLQKLQQKMRLGLPGTTSKALKQLMDESGEEQLPEYEEAEERPELYGSEESEVEELEEVDEEWVVVSAKQRKQARRKARKGKVPRAARKEKRSIETKSVETRPTETGMLIRFPVTQRSIPRDTAASILKEFLDSQILTEGKITTPSISLRALATALQDPNKSEKAQQLLQAFEQALGLDEKDPTEVMEEIKFRLDAPPTSKMDPFNKMVNMLSIVMAMDSETAEQVKFDFGKVTEAIIQQADVVRQRKEILSSMVDDIASQLKYEYAIMNDLAPGQRSVWMALDTQADTMRECCEKIGYLVR